jgi:hypothetical protein
VIHAEQQPGHCWCVHNLCRRFQSRCTNGNTAHAKTPTNGGTHLPTLVRDLVTAKVQVGVWECGSRSAQQTPHKAKGLITGGVEGPQLTGRLPVFVVAFGQQCREALAPALGVACRPAT